MLKKKKTTASGKLVLVKSVRRTRSHRMKFSVQRGLGALPSTSKRRGKSPRDFLLCGPVCINTGIACLFYHPPVSGILDNRFYLYLLGLADEHIASVGIKNYFSKVDLCLILQIVRQKYLTSSFVHSILKYS